MSQPPMVSIIMPVYNEERFLRGCMESLLVQDYPSDRLEVLAIDGGSSDQSWAIVEEYSRKSPIFHLLKNPKRVIPVALNIGWKAAEGEIIIRMDAHTVYDPDYVSACVELLQTSGAANVGGVQKAIGTSYLTDAIALATTCPFGVGDAYFRYAKKEMFVDTVFLGAWYKSTLTDLNGFDETFLANQDYELNYRLRERGGKILLSPRIRCKYYVRSTLATLIKQYSRYGFWKAKTIKKHPDSFMPRQAVPPLFVLAFFLSLLLVKVNLVLGLTIPLTYFFTNGLYAFRASIAPGIRFFPALVLIFTTIHFSWGIGLLLGVIKFGPPPVHPRALLKNLSLSKSCDK